MAPVLRLAVPVLLAWGTLSCGAEHAQAPAPESRQDEPAACGSFAELMPRFVAAISTGRTEGLREVVAKNLFLPERAGEAPLVNELLRSVFTTLGRFAQESPEAGAPDNELCAEPPPPLNEAHPLCEVRRSIRTLVHEGVGLELIQRVDPALTAFVNYIIGRAPSASQPHYEVAQVLSGMCSETATCRMQDSVDLLLAVTELARSERGRQMLDHFDALVNAPELQPFITDDGQQYGGEDGVVALARLVVTVTLGMEDPSDLDQLPLDILPAGLRTPAELLVGDLKVFLHPDATPNVLGPLKKVLYCHSVRDPNWELVRMLYRLGLEEDLDAVGLHALVRTVKELAAHSERPTVAHLANLFLRALRDDELALDALSRACRELFSTERSAERPVSNAERALPVVADLFAEGLASEAVCALDTLVYGCGAGPRPVCGDTASLP